MGRHAPSLDLTAAERDELERRIRARTSSQQAALRARVVLRAAAGESNTAIAAALGIARHTASTGGIASSPSGWRVWSTVFTILCLGCTTPPSRRRSLPSPVRGRPTWAGKARPIGRSWTWRPTVASIRSWGWGHPRRARSGTFSRRPRSAWTVFDSWMAERDPQFVEKAVAIIE